MNFWSKGGLFSPCQAQQSRLVHLASLRDMKTMLSKNLASRLVVPCHAVKEHPLAPALRSARLNVAGPAWTGRMRDGSVPAES